MDLDEGSRDRPIVVVIGMHRSGTSLCAQVLNLLGVDMADEAGARRGNELGHWERWDIVDLQDQVLASFDRDYFSPLHDYPLPHGWWQDARLDPLIDRMQTIVAEKLRHSALWGFKDPRTSKLLPLWTRIFSALGLAPRYVICLREPSHIAQSLLTRDSLDLEAGELRALDYVVDALRHTEGQDRCLVRYADWFPDPTGNLDKLRAVVGPGLRPRTEDLLGSVRAIVRPEMNRSSIQGAGVVQPLIREFFESVFQLAAGSGDNATLSLQIKTFTDRYIAFRTMFAPLEVKLQALYTGCATAEVRAARLEVELAEVKERHGIEAA